MFIKALFSSLQIHPSQASQMVDQAETPRCSAKRTCVYYANWTIYSRNHLPDDIPVKEVTNIFYSFFNVNGDTGEVSLSDKWADVEKDFKSASGTGTVYGLIAKFYELKKQNRHVKVSMSIGGWSNRDSFRKGVNTPMKLKKFVSTAVSTMLEYGFDGIDLDWEYPENRKEALTYLTIMRELRTSFRNIEREQSLAHDSFLLTIACPAFDEKLDLFDIKEMDECLSFWNLMTYDFAGEWSEKTGYHSNLYKFHGGDLCGDDAVKYFINRGIDTNKVVLGMANYGRSFGNTAGLGKKFLGVGPTSEDESEGIVNYIDLPPDGFQEEYDSSAVSAFAFNPEQKVFIGYDNVDSVTEKAKYVVRKGLGGGMWWESSGDSYNDPSKCLLYTFVKNVGGTESLDHSWNNITSYSNSKYLKENHLV